MYISPSDWESKFEHYWGNGRITSAFAEEAQIFSCSFSCDIVNNGLAHRSIRNLQLSFCKSKKELCKVEIIGRIVQNPPVSFYDISPINLSANESVKMNLKANDITNRDTINAVLNSNNVYLTYHTGKKGKHRTKVIACDYIKYFAENTGKLMAKKANDKRW